MLMSSVGLVLAGHEPCFYFKAGLKCAEIRVIPSSDNISLSHRTFVNIYSTFFIRYGHPTLDRRLIS